MRYALRYLGHRPGASLSYFTGAGVTLRAGDVFPITPEGFTFGRRASAGLRVASSSVAPQHARVWVEADGVRVVDLRSTNGTRVNEKPLPPEEPAVLAVGDRITLASAFDFEVIDYGAIKS